MLFPVRANERGPFGQLLLCHGQKISTPERPAHLPFVCSVFIVPWAEISTPERPAYLPSPVRANERGLFVELFFTVPRAEISTSERPAHLRQ